MRALVAQPHANFWLSLACVCFVLAQLRRSIRLRFLAVCFDKTISHTTGLMIVC